MNKYNVLHYNGTKFVEQVVEADGFQIGTHEGNIIFIKKGDKGEVTATHYMSNAFTVLLASEVS